MTTRRHQAVHAFLTACVVSASSGEPVRGQVGDTQLEFTLDCRGQLGLLEFRNAPRLDVAHHLAEIAD